MAPYVHPNVSRAAAPRVVGDITVGAARRFEGVADPQWTDVPLVARAQPHQAAEGYRTLRAALRASRSHGRDPAEGATGILRTGHDTFELLRLAGGWEALDAAADPARLLRPVPPRLRGVADGVPLVRDTTSHLVAIARPGGGAHWFDLRDPRPGAWVAPTRLPLDLLA